MKVIYVQCPNCKRGWYGERIDDFTIKTADGSIVDIQGTCHCFHCNTDYTPVSERMLDDDEHTPEEYRIALPYEENGEEKTLFISLEANTHVAVTEDFVADMIINCHGH